MKRLLLILLCFPLLTLAQQTYVPDVYFEVYLETNGMGTGISDIANTKSNLVKITDMLGQETPNRRNTPLFYIYDDGTAEKRIVIE